MSLKKSDVIALDFESYWDTHVTLQKMSTTEYIRHALFHPHTVSIKTSRGQWRAAYEDIPKLLARFNWGEKALLCHHTHFDGLILNEYYGHIPGYYLDTLSMSRPIHGGQIRNGLNVVLEHYGMQNKLPMPDFKGIDRIEEPLLTQVLDYNDRDVSTMWDLFWEKLVKWYNQDELDLIHYTIKAYCVPVFQVNPKIAKDIIKYEKGRRTKLLNKLGVGDPKQDLKTRAKPLRSREKFANMLRALDVEPPVKLNKDGKPTYAFAKTDLDFIELENHPNEDVRLLVETKQAVSSTIYISKPERMLLHTKGGELPLPIYLAYGKAHTLRWSGGDKLNPQSFTRRSKMREAVIAPKGYKFVIGDSAQIEARMNACLAGETELVEAFRSGEDIYSDFAANQVYIIPRSAVKKMPHRFVGKSCILGLGFRMGVPKFKYTLNSGKIDGQRVYLPNEEMYSKAVYGYRNRFKKIVEQWYKADELILTLAGQGEDVQYGPMWFLTNGAITLPNGLFLLYPGLTPQFDNKERLRGWKYNGNLNMHGGVLVENFVQSLSRIVVGEQILATARELDIDPKLLVHDEGIFCVPIRLAEKTMEVFLKHLSTPPIWLPELPVEGEVVISDCYIKP